MIMIITTMMITISINNTHNEHHNNMFRPRRWDNDLYYVPDPSAENLVAKAEAAGARPRDRR